MLLRSCDLFNTLNFFIFKNSLDSKLLKVTQKVCFFFWGGSHGLMIKAIRVNFLLGGMVGGKRCIGLSYLILIVTVRSTLIILKHDFPS